MNKLRYRIVFNKTRGMLMAVQETARSQGKGAGQSGALATSAPASMALPALRRIVMLLGAPFGGLLVAGAALAQIVADPNAPGAQRATVLEAANGVPQVNIQTPSAAGVSRNVYTQFDVSANGAILNNSRSAVQTQLGGWVQGNPWLAQGSARVILNEVNSANPSRLQGYLEVAGPRAEVVIANPAGIAVDGGGFINVSRATLTTGNPVLLDGQLTGFSVQRGRIAVDGAGLDATRTDYTALIARSVQLNAGVWAPRLALVTGSNEAAYEGAAGITQAATAGTGDAPGYAIDVAQLGGMYANQIYLVGTEAGVGVRNAGQIGAAAGDLVVTSSGRLENSGTLGATGAIALTAGTLHNSGAIRSGAAAVLNVQEAIDNRGGGIEAQRLDLAGGAVLNDGGRLLQSGASALAIEAARVVNAGTLGEEAAPAASGGMAAIDAAASGGGSGAGGSPGAGTVADSGNGGPAAPAAPAPLLAPGRIAAQLIDNGAGLIAATGGIALATAEFDNRGGKSRLDALSVSGAAFDNRGGVLSVRGDFHAATASFANGGALRIGGLFDAVSGQFSNASGLLQAASLRIDAAGQFDNSGGTLRQTGAGTASLRAGGEFRQAFGTLDMAGALALEAGAISGAGSTFNVTGDLLLASGTTSAAGGSWRVGGNASLRLGDLDNGGGAISSAGTLTLSSGALNNSAGRIAAGTDATIVATGALDNSGGHIQAARDLDLRSAATLENRAGAIDTLGAVSTLRVDAVTMRNDGGRIANAGTGAASLTAASLDTSGVISGNGNVAISAATLANGQAGRIRAAGAMTIDAATQASNAGSIAAGGTLALNAAGAFLANQGSVVAAGTLSVTAAVVDNSGGSMSTASGSGSALVLRTGQLRNERGTLQADGAAQIVVDGALASRDGQIKAGQDLALAAGRIDNLGGGAIEAAGRLQLRAQDLVNEGRIAGAGTDVLVGVANAIDNRGAIAANGALRIEAQRLDIGAEGSIGTTGDLVFGVAGRVANNGGAIGSGGTLRFEQAGAALFNSGAITAGAGATFALDQLVNDGGTIDTLAGAAFSLHANALANRQGRITAGGDASLKLAAGADNDGGAIQADATLDLAAGGALLNRAGIIESLGQSARLFVRADAIDSSGGRIVNAGSGTTTVSAAGRIDASGLVAGNGAVDIAAGTLVNGGTLSAGGALALAVRGSLDNAGTISAAGGIVIDQAALTLRNSGKIATTVGSQADIVLRAQEFDNAGGLVQGQRQLRIDADTVRNADGRIVNAGDGTLVLAAGSLSNGAQGSIAAGASLMLHVRDSLDNAGTLSSRGTLVVDAQDAALTNSGAIVSGSGAAINAGAIDNDGGEIATAGGSGASLVVDGASLSNRGGRILADDALTLTVAGALDNTGGALRAVSGAQVAAAGRLDNAGGVIETGDAQATLALQAASIDNGNGRIANAGQGATTVSSAGLLASSGAIAANGRLDLAAATLDNAGGATISSAGAMTATLGDKLDNRGTINSGGTLAIAAGSGALRNAGAIVAGGALDLQAGAIDNDGGKIGTAQGSDAGVGIAAASISNRGGAILADAEAFIASGAFVDNVSGTLQARGPLSLTAAGIVSNHGGVIETLAPAGRLALQAAALDNGSGRIVNVGSGNTDLAIAGRASSAGLIAGNGRLTLAAADIDNAVGGRIEAGFAMSLAATGSLANAGSIGSEGALALAAGTLLRNSGAIVAGGAAQAASSGAFDNRGGRLRAGDSLLLTAGGLLDNQDGVIEASGAAATLDVTAASIDNTRGRLVNVGQGGMQVRSAAAIVNGGTLAGNGKLVVDSASVRNLTGATLAAGQALELRVSTLLENAGAISSGGALSMDQAGARIANSGQMAAGGAMSLHAAQVANDGGQIATKSGAAIAIGSGSTFSNRGGTILAAADAALGAAGAFDNDGGLVQSAGSLDVIAGGALSNAGGTLEAAGANATLGVRAASLASSGRIVNAGAGQTRIDSVTSIVNSGAIAGNGGLALTAASLQNGAAARIDAGAALTLAVRQQLDNAGAIGSGATLRFEQAGAAFNNSGRIGARGALEVTAASIDNNGGQLYTLNASGAAVALRAASLANLGGTICADGGLGADIGGAVWNGGGTLHAGTGLRLSAGGAFENGSGTVETGAGTLALTAQSLASSGRIVNGGSGDTAIASQRGLTNSGSIAGNGNLTLDAASLDHQAGGEIASGRDLLLDVRQQLTNAGAISSGATLRFEQAGARFANSGQIAATGNASFQAASFNNNDGGKISTVRGGGGNIAVTAPELNNRGGAILADGRASLTIAGAADNTSGTLQAGAGLALASGGALANNGGTIEALGAAGSVVIDSAAIDNSAGRIINAGSGDMRLLSRSGITNSGAITTMGNLLLSGQDLVNAAGASIGAGGNLDFAITRSWTNNGAVSSGGTLTFNQGGASFTNRGQVLAGGNVVINAAQVDNNGGQLGTSSWSGADMLLTASYLSNQSGRIATDRDLAVNGTTVSNLGELFGGRDLALSMQGDYVQDFGAQLRANRDLSLAVTGNITNTAVFQAARNLTLSGQSITNLGGATIEAQGVTLRAGGTLANAGEINGATSLDIGAAYVNNSSGIVGGDVTLAAQNLDNSGNAALVGATSSLRLGVAGTLNNRGGATLYSSGNLAIGGIGGGSASQVNNNSSTIEAGADLTLAAETLTNVRENVQIVQVQTVDETRHMTMPGWYQFGDNHNWFEASAANYTPYELYFVNPADILEETQLVTPDGNTITRALIRTHANDSAYMIAHTGLYSAYGKQERLATTEGTRVIYYTQRDQLANPDQGGDANNALMPRFLTDVKNWDAGKISFSNQYGSCSSDCIRLVTQPGYTDPATTILRTTQRQLAGRKDALELWRDAHHAAVEDQLASGSGPAAQILAGGNMTLSVGSTLDNRYGDIKARGFLAMDGGADIRNEGATLYRTHSFDGTWRTLGGTTTAYTQPSISEVIGSTRGVIEGGQGVSISARSFTNVDVTAGSVGNIRENVRVIGSGAAGAAAAGAQAAAGSGSQATLAGAAAGTDSGKLATLAGAMASAAGGAGSGLFGAAASGIDNALQAGATVAPTDGGNTPATTSDQNMFAASGAASASGVRGGGRLQGAVTTALQAATTGELRTAAGTRAGEAVSRVQGQGAGAAMKVTPGGLFIRNPDAGGSYLYEARPQFANQKQWTSSDYLLEQLALHPATMQKRLGDGFYEQRLVREQLAELTGRTPRNGASDDSIYRSLLTNAVSAAREFDLRPGVALSAEQVGRLTSDIVWLESQAVQLPDGSVETVLVPKVYLAHVGQQALQPGGALVTGAGVSINTTESIVNRGGIIDGGNGRTLLLAGQDILNQGGAIAGAAIALGAGGDIRNETLAVKQAYASNNTSGSYTALSNQAAILTAGTLQIQAGRDLADLGGIIKAGAATLTAGRDISFNTVQTGSTYQHQVAGYTQNDSSITHQLSQLGTSGDLRLQAGANLNLTGTQVAIGGAGQLLAGGSIDIHAVTNEVNTALQNDPASKAYDKAVHRNQTVLGAGVAAAGDLTIDAGIAGSGSVNIAGSTLSAGGGVAIFATDNVNIASVQENRLSDTASTNSSSSVLRSTTTQQADYVASSMAIGSAISGKTVDVNAGKDINVRGSAIAGDGDVSLAAAGSVNIGAATSTLTEKHRTEVKKSGFLSGGGFGISYGERTTTTEQERDATTQSGQSRSMVGSLGGNLNIAAGEAIRISGSDLAAATDMTLDARSVSIDPGKDVAIGTFGQSTVQDGFTLKVGGTVIDTIQTLQSLSDAASQSKDGRVQALAAATAAMAAKSAASNVAKNGVNVSLSLTVGHSESEYTQSSSNLWNAGSTLNAGKDLAIRATGAGEDSNINVLGSTLSAQGTLTLKADNEVNLLAAQDKDSQHSDTRSMSAAVGVGVSVGTSGTAIGVTGSLSLGRGKEDGAGTTQLNTHVTAGKDLVIDSGGDTNVKGAVASGKRVVANVGGDLNLESLQDTATFASKNQSISVSGTYGAGASMSASVSDSSLKSDYASVQEQSGIRAGADGFQLNVQGNTDLKGAVVSSAREAIEQNRNTLVTGTLTHSDIENHADYKGHSIGLSGSYGTKPSDDEKSSASSALPEGWKPMAAAETGANAPIALGAAGSDKSVTRSGISGGVISINDPLKQQQAGGTSAEQAVAAVNRNVSNEQDTSGALANGFDRRSIQAGFEIVAAFTGQVTNLVADKARAIDAAKADADAHDTKADGLETIAESLPDGEQKARLLAEVEGLRSEAVGARVEAMDLEEKWGPGGAYRQVVSAFTAAASGNVATAGSELVQSAVINWAQSQAARGIKQLADDYGIEEGTPAHAAMHALSSCVGASAAGGNCAASALAGASTTFVSALLAAQDDGKLTSEQKAARQALVQTLVTGAAALAGADAAAANTAALIEMENNTNVVRAVKEAADKAQALLTKSGKEGLEKLGKVLEKLEVKTLVDKKGLIKKYLDEAGTRPGISDTEIAALGVIYAANEVLFPTSILDAPGPGKLLAAVKKAGTLIKAGHRAEDAARIAGVEARAADAAAHSSLPVVEAIGLNGVKALPLGVPRSLLDSTGKLPPGIGGPGTPIPMPPSTIPNATAEAFARAAFNGQTPSTIVPIMSGGSWVAKLPDGSVVTFRVAGDASASTAAATATVEVNSAAVKAINNGNVVKFKFPGQ